MNVARGNFLRRRNEGKPNSGLLVIRGRQIKREQPQHAKGLLHDACKTKEERTKEQTLQETPSNYGCAHIQIECSCLSN
jgi:hypothetical protein